MLLLQRETTAPARHDRSTTRLALRAGERLAELSLGKTTVGSSPRCNLRLVQPGVQPLQCLITRDEDSLRVRRWAGSVLLNGSEFQEAVLVVGDRLNVGSVELEVVELGGDGLVQTADVQPAHEAREECGECQGATHSSEELLAEVVAELEAEAKCEAMAQAAVETAVERACEVNVEVEGELIDESESEPEVEPSEETEEYVEHRVETPEAELPQLQFSEERAVDQSWQWPPDVSQPAEEIEDDSRVEDVVDALREHREVVDQLVERVGALEQGSGEWDCKRSQWESQLGRVETELAAVVRSVDELQRELLAFCTAELERAEQAERAEIEPAYHTQPVEIEQPKDATDEHDWSASRGPLSETTPEVPEVKDHSSPAESAHASGWGPVEERIENSYEVAEPRHGWGPAKQDSLDSREEASPTVDQPKDDRVESLFSPQHELTREEPQDEASHSIASPVPAQPQSFIERYSHLFPDEPEQPEQRPQLGAAAHSAKPAAPSWQTDNNLGNNAAKSPFSEQEEESIEQYMAKLLQRVRGEESPASQSHVPSVKAERKAAEPVVRSMPLSPDTIPHVSQLDADENGVSSDEPVSPSFWMDRKPTSSVAPATDLGALRALANESARRAISTHTLRKHRKNALTKVVVAVLAGLTSLLLMLQSPTWYHYQFIVACVTLMVAAFWAGEAYRTLHVSKKMAASDGDERDDQTASDVTLPHEVGQGDAAEHA